MVKRDWDGAMRRSADWERGSHSGCASDWAPRKYCMVSCMQTCAELLQNRDPDSQRGPVWPFLPIIDMFLLQACVYGWSVIALHVDVHGCVLTD